MIILMGLAGSGKSTQGQMLAEATGRDWISAGQVLRDTGDPKIKEITDKGELVPNELIERLMTEQMLQSVRDGRDVIIDGFPRDIEQAKWMAENLASVLKLVIIITVPKDELIQRLELRGRTDDTRDAILERFRIVEQDMVEVCKILQSSGVEITQVDGTGTREEVFARIQAIISASEQAAKPDFVEPDDAIDNPEQDIPTEGGTHA